MSFSYLCYKTIPRVSLLSIENYLTSKSYLDQLKDG